uniref:Glutamine amidotransferase class-I n=1 Tax=Solibacter usitatus (strain Ellin6076) TaxID=234267 RepID=Q01XS1_SOLUE
MRVLAFRHVPFEGLGLLEAALRERCVAIDYVDAYQAKAIIPAAEAYTALVFLGGPMSVNDDLDYLRREMEIIRQAAARRQPVLGICLGAQLIAKAMGARVQPNPKKEIGWFEVEFTDAAARDALFAGFSKETVFHWHGETFDLPEGAELLASSRDCKHQAYRLGSHLYGFQFHLEVTPSMVADWYSQDQNCGDVRELTDPIDPMANSSRMAELARVVFGRWCDSLRPEVTTQAQLAIL